MNSTTIWILVAFAAYMAMMLIIGASYMKTGKSTEDYFLGGRKLGGWVVALSAQASDMSGWLLMGLPGSVYALGTGQMWIAVGLFLGTVANWLIISGRLRRYTIVANNSLTLPAYFENRFHDKERILLGVSSAVIVIFFLVYTASAFASGGKLFSTVFGCSYHVSLTIGAVIILAYTFMGGFMAVCTTDFVQGMLMLIALVTVPIVAFALMGGNVGAALEQTGVSATNFLNVMKNGDNNFSAVEIISQLAWGLGYCGMPHILVRFMAVKNQKELNKSKGIAIIWVAISLAFAVVIGVLGRAFLYPTILGADGSSTEIVFIEMIKQVFTVDIRLPIVAGLFLCGILQEALSPGWWLRFPLRPRKRSSPFPDRRSSRRGTRIPRPLPS
jgi:sodium/proline symporter